MDSPIVLIIGCGVAGPVLAILLKRKGYHPIVFEKVRELGTAGASLMVMSNGYVLFGTWNLLIDGKPVLMFEILDSKYLT